MTLPQRLVTNPGILSGKPVIRGTRISAELVIELLSAGMSENVILQNYPGLEKQDIEACLSYASQLSSNEKNLPTSA